MGLHVKDTDAAKQDDDGQSCQQRRPKHAAQWIVDLIPSHFPSHFSSVPSSSDGRNRGDCHHYARATYLLRSAQFQRRREVARRRAAGRDHRSEEHTSELQSLMRISYAVFCLKKNKIHKQCNSTTSINYSTQINSRMIIPIYHEQ